MNIFALLRESYKSMLWDGKFNLKARMDSRKVGDGGLQKSYSAKWKPRKRWKGI